MRVSYRWTEQEWHEAVRLAERRKVRRPGLPGMTYALVGIPLLGALLDLRSTLRENSGITLAGSILPLLLLLIAFAAAALLSVAAMRRRRRSASAQTMPAGERELVMQEGGWRCDCPVGSSREREPGIETGLPALRALRPWSDVVEARQGGRVIVLVLRNGFEAVPTRSLTPEQGGHMHRMVTRKLRPTP
jgi:hypothetical protein